MDRRVLVTGGASGIGAAIVRALAEAGYAVDFTYRASADAAQALLGELRDGHPDRAFAAHNLDLADRAALDGFCEGAEAAGYYGLVHNAGQPCDALAAMLDQERAEAAMQVNFFSLTRLAKALMREMIRVRAGRIVAIGSVAALRGNAGNAAYAATKGALIAYCRTLALETAKRGVTVNVVAPGWIPVERHEKDPQEVKDAYFRMIPMNRWGVPLDVANAVLYFASEEASFVTGQTLCVNGGATPW